MLAATLQNEEAKEMEDEADMDYAIRKSFLSLSKDQCKARSLFRAKN